MKIRYSDDPAFRQGVADYVLSKFPELQKFGRLKPSNAISVLDGEIMVGGIVMTNANGVDAQLSIFLEKPVAFLRADLKALFGYCFDDMNLKRITCRISVKNPRSCQFVERLGFKREGVMRLAYDGEQHAAIYGMVRKDCKWLKG